MSTSFRRWLKVVPLFSLAAAVAQAHPGHDGHELTWDFGAGFAHPFSGWDHLLAMIAVGWWAAQLGGRARYFVPLTFVGLMTGGAIFGAVGASVPGVEQAIAASVLVLGLLIARSIKLPLEVAMVMTGAFAVFHGLAHGSEARASGAGLPVLLGFMAATAVLHGIGLLLGAATKRLSARVTLAGGATVAVCGAAMLLS